MRLYSGDEGKSESGPSVNFYDVRGVLVRRRVPARRKGISLEVCNGDDWLPYPEVDAVLRYGLRLTEAHAVALLHGTRNRIALLPRLSDPEARMALRAAPRSE